LGKGIGEGEGIGKLLKKEGLWTAPWTISDESFCLYYFPLKCH